MSKVKWSKAQKAQRKRFKQAMADPNVRAHYEKAATKAGTLAFRVAVSDNFAGKNLLKTPSARGQSKGHT